MFIGCLILQFFPADKRVARMARLRLQYDEARKRRTDLQKKLAQIHDSEPQTCANDNDRDRYVYLSSPYI